MSWLRLDAYKTLNTAHIVLLDISPVRDEAMMTMSTGQKLEFHDPDVVAILRAWVETQTRPGTAPAGKLGKVTARAIADLDTVRQRLRGDTSGGCHNVTT